MPGLDYISKINNVTVTSDVPTMVAEEALKVPGDAPAPGVYYNARLDPKNYLEGPLSLNPATRLRQMLARPGIVVRLTALLRQYERSLNIGLTGCARDL